MLLLAAAHRAPAYIAGAVNVMCAQTGLVLYEYRQHEKHYPASLVKVMTALVVLENVTDLDEIIVMSETAVALPWYAANMRLSAGDQLTVWEALHGIMLPSANEVANALAEFVAGSLADFLGMMNARAYELGAVNTHFVNACGLPGDGQHITAYDMSLIMREAVTHPVFLEIIGTEFFTFPASIRHPEGRTLRNTNRLIRDEDSFYSQFVVGGKTGWIRAAKNTLSTYSVQDNRGLIVTVLYTEGAAATFADTIALLSHGFSQLAGVPLPATPPREIVINTPQSDAPAVLHVPAATYAPPPQAPPTAVPTPSPWEAVTAFALVVAKLLAGVTVFAGVGIFLIYFLRRKIN